MPVRTGGRVMCPEEPKETHTTRRPPKGRMLWYSSSSPPIVVSAFGRLSMITRYCAQPEERKL